MIKLSSQSESQRNCRPVSATARQHNRCLAPLDDGSCMDHDFYGCEIIPFVVFKSEIPNPPFDTFFKSDVHVVLKGKICHPSNALRGEKMWAVKRKENE